MINGNAQTIPASPGPLARPARGRSARKTGFWLCIITLHGCVLLRSAPLPPDEWSAVVFPGADGAARTLARAVAAGIPVVAECAAPDTLTFAVRAPCDGTDGLPPDRRRPLLLVSNWSAGGYRADILRAVMADPPARERFATQASTLADSAGYGGMLLDFRSLGARDVNALVDLVTAVADSARARSLFPVGVVVPVADTAAYPGRHLGALADLLALRLELELASPGPLTPRDGMARLIGARAAEIGAHRIQLLLPADGYVWRNGEERARVTHETAVATARDWGVELARDESSGTLRARAPGRGEIWVNDAVLISRIVRDARRLGIRKFALYGLGGEDPAIWTAVAAVVTR